MLYGDSSGLEDGVEEDIAAGLTSTARSTSLLAGLTRKTLLYSEESVDMDKAKRERT